MDSPGALVETIDVSSLLDKAELAAGSGDHYLGAFTGPSCSHCGQNLPLLVRFDLGAWDNRDHDGQTTDLFLAFCLNCERTMVLCIYETGTGYRAFTYERGPSYVSDAETRLREPRRLQPELLGFV